MLSIIRENDSASLAERNGKDPGRYESYRRLYDLGLNLVPKRSRDPKAAAKPWKQWQTERLPLDVFLDYLNYARQNNVNMAIVTGAMPWHDFGIVVVDPDDAEALTVVQKRCPDTPVKSITGRGQHWVYRHPRKGPIHNATGIEIDGVDYDICIKGDGGMCTAPGSLHANGSIYQEVAPWTLHLLGSAPVWDDLWLPRPTWEDEDWDEQPDAKHEKHISRSDLIPMAERAKLAWERLRQEGGTREGTGEASKKCFRLAVEMLWKYALSQAWAGAILA